MREQKTPQFSLRKKVKLSISPNPPFIPELPFTELRQRQESHLEPNKEVYSIIKTPFAHHPPLLQGEQCCDFCVWSCIIIIPVALKNDFVNSKGHCPLRHYSFDFRSSHHWVTSTLLSSPELPVLII